MTSAIEMCSKALIKISGSRIQSFDEGTKEAEIASALYDTTRDTALSAYPWTFALEQVSLARQLPDPTADYRSAYALPADTLIVRSLGTSGRGRGERYRIAGSVVQTDAAEVILSYIRRVPEALMPPYFQMVLIAALAAEFVIPLTDSTARWQGMQQLAAMTMREGRRIDAQQATPSEIESFPLVEARG